jgi:hypothetical protein
MQGSPDVPCTLPVKSVLDVPGDPGDKRPVLVVLAEKVNHHD